MLRTFSTSKSRTADDNRKEREALSLALAGGSMSGIFRNKYLSGGSNATAVPFRFSDHGNEGPSMEFDITEPFSDVGSVASGVSSLEFFDQQPNDPDDLYDSGDEELSEVSSQSSISCGTTRPIDATNTAKVDKIIATKIQVQILNSDSHEVILLKKKINNFVPKEFPADAAEPFDKNNTSKVPVTKGEVALKLHDLFSRFSSPSKFVMELVNILNNSAPSINWPIRPTTRAKNELKAVSIVDYVEEDRNDFKIDMCKNGCTAFCGMKTIRGKEVNLEHCLYCVDPTCQRPRFSKCKYCPTKPYASCDPYRYMRDGCKPFVKPTYAPGESTKKTLNEHSVINRIPLETSYYRGVASNIIDRVVTTLTDEKQKDLLSYDKVRVKKVGLIIDTLDGKVVKDEIADMHLRYVAALQNFTVNGVRSDELIECSLALTIFYDGKINFKRKLDSMWPLLCSIINCNPSQRSKMGSGMFLTCLHDLPTDSEGEKFLIEKMLVGELAALEKGFLVQIDLSNGETKYVFLQARCVYAQLDTKALEKFGRFKGSGSNSGCPLCNQCRGSKNTSIDVVTYIGARQFLCQNHFLRCVGECDFTNPDDEKSFHNRDKHVKDHYKVEAKGVKLDTTAIDPNASYENTNAPGFFALRNADPLLPSDKYTWANPKFPFSMFQGKLRYPTTDFTTKVVYKARSNEDYRYCGDVAEQKEAVYLARCILDPGLDKKKKPDFSVKGVHGVNALVKGLKHFHFSSFCFDWMHYVANVGKYRIQAFKGDRLVNRKSRKEAVSTDKHPDLRFMKLDPPWTGTDNCQDKTDAVMNTVMVPSAYKSDHNMKNVMKHNKYVKFHELLMYLIVYSPYCMSFSSSAPEYQCFAARYADDLCRVLDPQMTEEGLESLIASVYETRAIQEGLFPEADCVFIFHEIVCILHHILDYGHVRGLSCYSGERALGLIAASVSKGGVHYLKSMYYKYIAKELFMDTTIKSDFIDVDGRYSDFVMKLVGKGKPLKGINMNLMYEGVFSYLETEPHSDMAYSKSPSFRLFKAFQCSKVSLGARFGVPKSGGFYDWMKELDSIFDPNDATMMQSSSEEVRTKYSKLLNCIVACESGMAPSFESAGTFYFSDFKAVKVEILSFVPVVHERVIIKGVTFQARGNGRQENDLDLSCFERKQYCSYMRFQNRKKPDVDKTTFNLVPSGSSVTASTSKNTDTTSTATASSTALIAVTTYKDALIAGNKRKLILPDMRPNPPDAASVKPVVPVAAKIGRSRRNIVIVDQAQNIYHVPSAVDRGSKSESQKDVVVVDEDETLYDKKGKKIKEPKFVGSKTQVRANVTRSVAQLRDAEKKREDEQESVRQAKIARVEHQTAVTVSRRNAITETTQFGQCNFCFRVRNRNDSVLDGLAFAYMSVRESIYDANRWHHYFQNYDGVDKVHKKFIALDRVTSTAIALHCLDKEQKMMLKQDSNKKYNSDDIGGKKKDLYSGPGAKLDRMYMLELHPERLNVSYDTLYEDKSRLQLWET